MLQKSLLLADTIYNLLLKNVLLITPILTIDIDRHPRLAAIILSQFENTEACEFGVTSLKEILDIVL